MNDEKENKYFNVVHLQRNLVCNGVNIHSSLDVYLPNPQSKCSIENYISVAYQGWEICDFSYVVTFNSGEL